MPARSIGTCGFSSDFIIPITHDSRGLGANLPAGGPLPTEILGAIPEELMDTAESPPAAQHADASPPRTRGQARVAEAPRTRAMKRLALEYGGNEGARPAVAGGRPAKARRTAAPAPATAPRNPGALGCSKCRFSEGGCGRCRARADLELKKAEEAAARAAAEAAAAAAAEAEAEAAAAAKKAREEARAKAKAESAAQKAKKEAEAIAAAAAGAARALGCSKCRYSKTGCKQCRAAAKKAAAANKKRDKVAAAEPRAEAPAPEAEPEAAPALAEDSESEDMAIDDVKATAAAVEETEEAAAPATAEVAPAPAAPALGCSKCRYCASGCGECRFRAAKALPQPARRSRRGAAIEAPAPPAAAPMEESGAEEVEAVHIPKDEPAAAVAEQVEEEKEEETEEAPAAEAEAAAPAAPQFGCSKCRHSKDGCNQCRATAAAAARAAATAPSGHPTEEVLPPAPPAAPDTAQAEPDPEWWDPLDAEKVAAVQAALHVSSAAIPGRLPICRNRQIEAVDSWLFERLSSAQGGSLYVSGLPGTGKTLTTLELVRRCGRHAAAPGSRCALPPALVAVNCMRFSEPRQVVERILAGYATACRQSKKESVADPLVQVPDVDLSSSIGSDPQEALRQVVMAPLPVGASAPADEPSGKRAATARSRAPASEARGMIVAVLDELDGLLTGRAGDALVGELFALAHAPRSRLILIGVANSIDLVQQMMRPGGELHRRNLRPAHEIFPAYLSGQVAELAAQRLAALPGPVFDPKTLLFCARKVANGSGDMRRALEACSKAVAIHVADAQERAAVSAAAEAAGPSSAGPPAAADGAVAPSPPLAEGVVAVPAPRPLVSMRQMAAALGRVTGGIGASNDHVSAIRKLPVPQQLLMATVSKLLGERMNSRGLAVRVPGQAAAASAAARFIGSAAVEQPLLAVSGGSRRSGPFADGPRRRSGAAPGPGELTVGDLQAAHAGLCKRVGVGLYSSGEFATAVDMLRTLGLVELRGGAQAGARRRVVLAVAEDDVMMALADVPVLKNVVGA